MKKDLNYYLNLNYKMEIIEDDDQNELSYILSYPELDNCITISSNLEEGIKNLKAAKKEWICACLEEGLEIPEPNGEDEYSGSCRLIMPKSLHKNISVKAKQEGISLNQYCVYVLSKEIAKNSKI